MRNFSIVVRALSTLAALMPLVTAAQPVELETDGAHIIVVRPVDIWSGDASTQNNSLEAIRNKEVSYDVVLNGGLRRGSPVVFQGVSDDPVTLGVQSALSARDTRLVRKAGYLFHIEDATSLAPADYSAFAQAQSDYRQLLVQREGDPESLQGRTRVGKFFGGLLSIGSLFIPSSVLGAGGGAEFMLSTGFAADIGAISGPVRAALIPVVLPSINPADYQAIDVRRVEFSPEAPGEIIIAYRTGKTADTERSALIKAIVTLAGADTTAEAVEASRQSDFKERVSMWDACVANGKCQKEASNVEH